ncbi:unnamed protein product [Closterium sp. NIES-65]|nr:unnamed protein product [Closterium sp. NIES-65]
MTQLPRSDTYLEIIRLNALAAETPFCCPLSHPSLPVALSLSALFPSPPFPSRSLSPLPSHRALSLSLCSLPFALSPVALSLPPPLPPRSLSLRSLPVALSPVALSSIALALSFALSRRPLSRRPLSYGPRSLFCSVLSPSLPSPSISHVALALSRRPRSLPSPPLSPVASRNFLPSRSNIDLAIPLPEAQSIQ